MFAGASYILGMVAAGNAFIGIVGGQLVGYVWLLTSLIALSASVAHFREWYKAKAAAQRKVVNSSTSAEQQPIP